LIGFKIKVIGVYIGNQVLISIIYEKVFDSHDLYSVFRLWLRKSYYFMVLYVRDTNLTTGEFHGLKKHRM